MAMIQEQASTLNHVYNESNMHSFYDTYVLGNKLGEGQHAIVYKCFKRVHPRSAQEATTPFNVDKMTNKDYYPTPYAVKIVRTDDLEKINAHKRESEIL